MDGRREFRLPKVVMYGVGTVVGLGGLTVLAGATVVWRAWDSLRRNGW